MALAKTIVTSVNNQEIAENTEYAIASCTAADCSAVIVADVECVCTYAASSTLAATVKIYASSDGTNYGSQPVDQFTMPFVTNTTQRWSKTVIPSAKYLKATIKNNDTGNYHLTAVYVYITTQA
jgi:hypothetical protein